MTNSEELRSAMLAEVEDALLATAAPIRQGPAADMYDLIAYHMGWKQGSQSSGKRIRPLLTLLSCAAAGGDWRSTLPIAASIEWLHNFSLIHDDIEDQSRTRRGRETLWSKVGIPLAINTGDALFALSRSSIYGLLDHGVSPGQMINFLRILDQTAISLCEGQHLDMRFENETEITPSDYMAMITGKTSVLIACACELGAMLSPADAARRACYREFGRNLGLAFQMQDDILGIWGRPERTGKPSGDDLLLRKKTLPVILGFERSTQFRSSWQAAVEKVKVSDLITDLDDAGIRPIVQSMADDYSAAALLALKEASPENPAGELLNDLLRSLLRRDN